MELRALLAVILSMGVLASYQYFFVPAPPEELPPLAEAPTASETAPPTLPPATTAEGDEPGAGIEEEAPSAPVVNAASESQTTIIAENYRVSLTNRGARIASFVLSGYRDDYGADLELVSAAARNAGRLPLEWVAPTAPEDAATLNDALFEMTVSGGGAGSERVAGPDDPVLVRFEWADGAGRSASKEFAFPASGNVIDVRAGATGFADLFLGLGAGLDEVPVGLRNAYLAENALSFGANGLEKWSAADLTELLPDATPNGYAQPVPSPLWVGVESHYFMGAFLLDASTGATRATLGAAAVVVPAAPDDAEATPLDHVLPMAAAELGAFRDGAPIYFGPKKLDYLTAQGHGLENAVDFGMLSFVSRPLLWVLNAIESFFGNYGIAIILLTALLRLAFWPLNQKAMTSMRKTQKLQPKMSAIRGKYKGAKDLESRQKMNEEVMALYKQEGVSPLGGCLPMLAQIPILFAFYALLSVAVELRQAPFVLWVTDLSRHDPYLVLPLLMGGSMIAQQRMTPQTAMDPQQQSMMRMMRLMPIIFTVMFLYVPSGLVLYWLVNNLLGIAQQLYVNRSMDRQAEAEKAERKAARLRAKSERGKKK